MKYQPKGRPRGSSSDDGNNHITRTFSLVCFWGSHNWYIGVVCLYISVSLFVYDVFVSPLKLKFSSMAH